MTLCSAGPQAAGIWSGNGAHEKGATCLCFLDDLCWQVLGRAARRFVLVPLLLFALDSNYR